MPDQLPWHSAPRRWGHKLHSQCSYMAMFPPALPHHLIHWLTEPGDVVYDAFSGRGTVLLEAGLLGRIPAGSDANPLAWILTSAKAQPPCLDRTMDRIADLSRGRQVRDVRNVPEHVRQLFDRAVLAQLVSIQRRLCKTRSVDRFLLATLCGILHANAKKDGTPRGLTIAMPNTFSMSPGYVGRYMKAKQLRPPSVDVLGRLRERVQEILPPNRLSFGGKAWMADARDARHWPATLEKANLILSSPPYLRVMKYGKLNWLRAWLIGCEPTIIDRQLFASTSLHRYVEFMKQVLSGLRQKIQPSGRICLVIGDVQGKQGCTNLAVEVIRHCLRDTDLQLHALLIDHLPVKHKVSRIWGDTRGRATKIDRIIVLGGPKARELPSMPSVDWVSAQPSGDHV